MIIFPVPVLEQYKTAYAYIDLDHIAINALLDTAIAYGKALQDTWVVSNYCRHWGATVEFMPVGTPPRCHHNVGCIISKL